MLLLALGVLLLASARGARDGARRRRHHVAVAVMVLPLGEWASAPLEHRFPQPELPQRVDGIIVLGGAVSLGLTKANGQVALNDMAARLTETLALARRYPNALVLLSGGDAALVPRGGLTEAAATRSLLVADGLDASRVLIEDPLARYLRERALFEGGRQPAAGPELGARHLGEPYPARDGLLPPGRLGRHSLSRRLRQRDGRSSSAAISPKICMFSTGRSTNGSGSSPID